MLEPIIAFYDNIFPNSHWKQVIATRKRKYIKILVQIKCSNILCTRDTGEVLIKKHDEKKVEIINGSLKRVCIQK